MSGLKLKIYVFALTVFMCYGFSFMNGTIIDKIVGKLAIYAAKESPEKIYVHTDKNLYTNGDTLWFKAYLVDGILHKPSEKSEVVYVELLNSKDSILAKRKLKIDELGAFGDIVLPNNLSDGKYLLRAYTKYMLNSDSPIYFQKEIPVFHQEIDLLDKKINGRSEKSFAVFQNLENSDNTETEVKVQLFPEGGNLVVGQTSILGIKISNLNNENFKNEGSIVNSNDEPVAFFKVHETGLGTVTFTPEFEVDYYAKIKTNGKEVKFPVPKALSNGYVMSIRNNSDHLILSLATNMSKGLEGTFVIGHFRGDTFFSHVNTTTAGNTYSIKLKTDRLLDGIAHFTLFTAKGEPVCERIVFVDHPDNDIQLLVKSDKDKYNLRDKVTVELDAVNKDDLSFKGNFSMSVISKSNRLPHGMVESDIKSWLLLDSDLGGTVEDPGYFFEDNSRERKFLLDALMLTHGWRRFVWKEFLNDNDRKVAAYKPEKFNGLTVSGYTTLENNPKALQKSTIQLSIPGRDLIDTRTTDEKGRFSFGPFDLKNGEKTYLKIVGHPNEKKKAKKNLVIYLDKEWPEVPIIRNKKSKLTGTKNKKKSPNKIFPETTSDIKSIKAYLRQTYLEKAKDFKFDSTITQLEGVTVRAKSKKLYDKTNLQTSQGAGIRVIPDSIASAGMITAMDVIGRAGGVTVKGDFPNQFLVINTMGGLIISKPNGTIKVGGNILYMLNGIEVSSEVVQHLNASDILFVDVLRGTEAAVYGPRAAGGAISITTKNKSLNRGGKSILAEPSQIIPNFYKVREFYSPDYGVHKSLDKQTDYRTTLHWQPNIAVEDMDSNIVQFYTGDAIGDFVVKVEGITKDGRAVAGYCEFSVQ